MAEVIAIATNEGREKLSKIFLGDYQTTVNSTFWKLFNYQQATEQAFTVNKYIIPSSVEIRIAKDEFFLNDTSCYLVLQDDGSGNLTEVVNNTGIANIFGGGTVDYMTGNINFTINNPSAITANSVIAIKETVYGRESLKLDFFAVGTGGYITNNEGLPEPLPPDSTLNFLRSGVKQIIATGDGQTKDFSFSITGDVSLKSIRIGHVGEAYVDDGTGNFRDEQDIQVGTVSGYDDVNHKYTSPTINISFKVAPLEGEQVYLMYAPTPYNIFYKNFVEGDIVVEADYSASINCLLQAGEAGKESWEVNDRQYFELGIFSEEGKMIFFSTFSAEVKTPEKIITNRVRLVI